MRRWQTRMVQRNINHFLTGRWFDAARFYSPPVVLLMTDKAAHSAEKIRAAYPARSARPCTFLGHGGKKNLAKIRPRR
jgi:hypothetical protein